MEQMEQMEQVKACVCSSKTCSHLQFVNYNYNIFEQVHYSSKK